MVEPERPQMTVWYGPWALHAGWVRLQTHSEYLTLLLSKNCYANAPKCYVTRTLPVLSPTCYIHFLSIAELTIILRRKITSFRTQYCAYTIFSKFYVFLLGLCILIVQLPWLKFFRAISSVVRQMPGYNSPRRGTARTVPIYFCVVLCIALTW
jgi:hypothetical protein